MPAHPSSHQGRGNNIRIKFLSPLEGAGATSKKEFLPPLERAGTTSKNIFSLPWREGVRGRGKA
jgi:hypothetical protein